jgi:hypothetical protein
MLIEVTDDLIELGMRYLYRKPVDMLALANSDDTEYNIECLPVKLIFQPSEPESIMTVKRTKFISVDLDAGDEFNDEHVHIYIPKKFVDHPRTVFGIFIDGIWLDHYYGHVVAANSVFLTKREATQYIAENREQLKNLGVE